MLLPLGRTEGKKKTSGKNDMIVLGVLALTGSAFLVKYAIRREDGTYDFESVQVDMSDDVVATFEPLDISVGPSSLEVPQCYIPIPGGSWLGWDTPLFDQLNYVLDLKNVNKPQVKTKLYAVLKFDGLRYRNYITQELLEGIFSDYRVYLGAAAVPLTSGLGLGIGLLGAAAIYMVVKMFQERRKATVEEENLKYNLPFMLKTTFAYLAQIQLAEELVKTNCTLLLPQDKEQVLSSITKGHDNVQAAINDLDLRSSKLGINDLVKVSTRYNEFLEDLQNSMSKTAYARTIEDEMWTFNRELNKLGNIKQLNELHFARENALVLTDSDEAMMKTLYRRFALLNIKSKVSACSLERSGSNYIYMFPEDKNYLSIRALNNDDLIEFGSSETVCEIGPIMDKVFKTSPVRSFMGEDTFINAVNESKGNRMGVSGSSWLGGALVKGEFEKIELNTVDKAVSRLELERGFNLFETLNKGAYKIVDSGYEVTSPLCLRSKIPLLISGVDSSLPSIEVGYDSKDIEKMSTVAAQVTAAGQTLKVLNELGVFDPDLASFLLDAQAEGVDIGLVPNMTFSKTYAYTLSKPPLTFGLPVGSRMSTTGNISANLLPYMANQVLLVNFENCVLVDNQTGGSTASCSNASETADAVAATSYISGYNKWPLATVSGLAWQLYCWKVKRDFSSSNIWTRAATSTLTQYEGMSDGLIFYYQMLALKRLLEEKYTSLKTAYPDLWSLITTKTGYIRKQIIENDLCKAVSAGILSNFKISPINLMDDTEELFVDSKARRIYGNGINYRSDAGGQLNADLSVIGKRKALLVNDLILVTKQAGPAWSGRIDDSDRRDHMRTKLITPDSLLNFRSYFRVSGNYFVEQNLQTSTLRTFASEAADVVNLPVKEFVQNGYKDVEIKGSGTRSLGYFQKLMSFPVVEDLNTVQTCTFSEEIRGNWSSYESYSATTFHSIWGWNKVPYIGRWRL